MNKQILSTFTPDTGTERTGRRESRFIVQQPPPQIPTHSTIQPSSFVASQSPSQPGICINPTSFMLAPAEGTNFHTSTVVGEDGTITKIIYVEGPSGRPGINGRDGINGENGENGRPGLPGNDGKDGMSIRGPKGDSIKGDPGEEGKQGPRGFDGNPGKDGRDAPPCNCKGSSDHPTMIRIIRSKGTHSLDVVDKLVVIDTSEAVTLILPETRIVSPPEIVTDFYYNSNKIKIICYSGTHQIKCYSQINKINKYLSSYSISSSSQGLQTKCLAVSLDTGDWVIV